MITLVLDELLRLIEAESATKSLREARAGPELDPRVVCSGLLLSEQGPSLGTRMCLANFLEVAGVGGAWCQAPLSPGSRGSPRHSRRIASAFCSAALPVCLSFRVTCVRRHACSPDVGQGLPGSHGLLCCLQPRQRLTRDQRAEEKPAARGPVEPACSERRLSFLPPRKPLPAEQGFWLG